MQTFNRLTQVGVVLLGLVILLIVWTRAQPISAQQVLPTAVVATRVPPRIVIPVPVQATAPAVIVVFEQPTMALPLQCVLATWADGSQSCDDGSAIDAEHSQPGYCIVIQWDTGAYGCNDGKQIGQYTPPTRIEQRPDPSGARGDFTVSTDQRCVTAINPSGDAETRCADEPMSQATIEWLSRAIEDGRVPGTGVPKG